METVIEKKLAIRIRELRQKAKLTQEQLAELAGVDYKHIQLLEGKNPPATKINTLEKISKALGVPLPQLLKF